jgi:hypothetical protein
VLQKEVADRCAAQGFKPEWDEVRRDLDRLLQEVEVEQDGKRFILRTPTTGCAGKLFQTRRRAVRPGQSRRASRGAGRYLLATPIGRVKEIKDEVLSRPGRYAQITPNSAPKRW